MKAVSPKLVHIRLMRSSLCWRALVTSQQSTAGSMFRQCQVDQGGDLKLDMLPHLFNIYICQELLMNGKEEQV